MKGQEQQTGFSLIELLVVLTNDNPEDGGDPLRCFLKWV